MLTIDPYEVSLASTLVSPGRRVRRFTSPDPGFLFRDETKMEREFFGGIRSYHASIQSQAHLPSLIFPTQTPNRL